jgi:hypothetical protein
MRNEDCVDEYLTTESKYRISQLRFWKRLKLEMHMDQGNRGEVSIKLWK